MDWKAHIQNGKLPEGAILYYYTHYFFYYTHYLSWLNRIAASVSTSYALRFYTHPILCVTTSLWNIGEAAIAVESAQTVTIIAIMSLLLQLFFQLYALFQNKKSLLGLEFIADYRPIASSITDEQCL